MKFWPVFVFLAVLFGSCSKKTIDSACIDESAINPEVMCTMQYEPVCGCDKKTYGNECMARKSGVQKWTMGECPD